MKKLIIFMVTLVLVGCQTKVDHIKQEILSFNETNNISVKQNETLSFNLTSLSNDGEINVFDYDGTYCYVEHTKDNVHYFYKVDQQGEKTLLYTIEDLQGDEGLIFTKVFVTNNQLVITYSDRNNAYYLIRVSSEGELIKSMKIEKSQWLDVVYYNDKYIVLQNVISSGDNELSQFIEVNLEDNSDEIILNEKATYNDGVYNGTIIPGRVGFLDDSGFVFARTKMNKEDSSNEDNGTTTICFYNMNTHKVEELFEYDYRTAFVYGNKDVILLEDYRTTNDNVINKKIILLENNEYQMYDIHEDSANANYRVQLKGDTLYYIDSGEGLLKIYDFKKHEYTIATLTESDDDLEYNEGLSIYHQKVFNVIFDNDRAQLTEYTF